MYNNNTVVRTEKYILAESIEVSVEINKYLIKIIDFGFAKKQNNNLVKKKIAHNFKNFPFGSEIFLILYFYLHMKCCGKMHNKKKECSDMTIKKLLLRISKEIIKNHNIKTLIVFDSYLIKYVIDKNI